MLRIWFIASLALLVGCAPTSKPVLLAEKTSGPESEQRWAKYGAYYLVDELFVESSFFNSPIVQAPTARYIVNKKLKILTREGIEYATLRIPFYTETPPVMRLAETDSSGRPMKLDTAAIAAEYRKSGKLIFPGVTAGCLLEAHLEFNGNKPISVFEHWFSGPAPVAHGRLTLSHIDKYNYDFAEYGPVRRLETPASKEEEDELIYRTWDVRDIFPRSRLDFQEDIDATEPRVSVVLRSYQGQPVFTDWQKLSEKYEEVALKTSFFESTRKLEKKVDEVTRGLKGDAERAQAVFLWVEDNISFKQSNLESIDPDKVMASGQGNMWEMAVVLREMFKHLGLKTDVVVTRPRSLGGFDSKFETPLQLGVPLVVVEVGGRKLLAFPYSRGAALGEYPEDYFGLSGLSLTYQDSTNLPALASGDSYMHATYRIDPSAPDADQEMDLELGGYPAFQIRNALFRDQKKEVKDVFQRMLTQIGTSNSLQSCRVDSLNDRGKPMIARLTFANPNQSIERKDEMQMRLSHLFPVYFDTYDTSRAAGFKTTLEVDHVERLEAAKVPGKKLEAVIPCKETANPLFKVTCRTEENEKSFIFTREVFVHRKKLSAGEMRILYPDIVELNRIRDARLVLRGAAAAKAKGKQR